MTPKVNQKTIFARRALERTASNIRGNNIETGRKSEKVGRFAGVFHFDTSRYEKRMISAAPVFSLISIAKKDAGWPKGVEF